MTTGPKRHHHVPRFYLDRFATEGKVSVRRRDGGAFDASPRNVAVESGFYDIPDGTGGTSKEIEHGLADIEGMTDAVLRGVDLTGRLPGQTDPDSATLAMFVGLQIARTTIHREQVMFPRRFVDWAGGREVTRDAVAEYLEHVHLGFEPEPSEVDGAYTIVSAAVHEEPHTLTDVFAVEMMLRSGWEAARHLLGLHWSIEYDHRREFITSDTPAVLWRKPTRRDEFEGLGVKNATEIRFPLDPGKQLVFSRRKRRERHDVEIHRVRRSNKDMAAACHRFIVGNPEKRAQLDGQRLARWRPVIRFNVGPLLETGPNGRARRSGGDIVHTWLPRRAGVGRPRGRRG